MKQDIIEFEWNNKLRWEIIDSKFTSVYIEQHIRNTDISVIGQHPPANILAGLHYMLMNEGPGFFWSTVPFRTAQPFTSRYTSQNTHKHAHSFYEFFAGRSPMIAPDFRNGYRFMAEAASSENQNWQAHLHRGCWLNVAAACAGGRRREVCE